MWGVGRRGAARFRRVAGVGAVGGWLDGAVGGQTESVWSMYAGMNAP